MNSRRHALALAAALTVSALTGAIAIAGLSHHSHPAPTTPQAQIVRLAPAPTTSAWADD